MTPTEAERQAVLRYEAACAALRPGRGAESYWRDTRPLWRALCAELERPPAEVALLVYAVRAT